MKLEYLNPTFRHLSLVLWICLSDWLLVEVGYLGEDLGREDTGKDWSTKDDEGKVVCSPTWWILNSFPLQDFHS